MSTFNLKWFPSQVLRLEVVAQTANFTAENGKLYVVNPAGASVDVTLPAPAANTLIMVKDLSGDIPNKTINIIRNSTELIDGVAANVTIGSEYETISLFSDGVDWYRI